MQNSLSIKQEVYNNDIYKLKSCNFERPAKNFVDIGANVGWFTKLIVDNFSECNVYSYELDRSNYLEIQKNLDLKESEKSNNNLNIYNKAVIGVNKFTKYWKHDSNIGGHKPLFQGSDSYISEEKFNFETALKKGKIINEVPEQVTLPQIIKENSIDYIDFLKLDCEGSEYEILEYTFSEGEASKILNMALEIHGRRTEGYSAFIEKLKSCFDTVEVGYNIVFAKNKINKKEK